MYFIFKVLLLVSHKYKHLQPVNIADPHLVSSLFDDCTRAYLHVSTELVNKSSSVAECDLIIQVTTELEGNICLVEHLQKEHLSIHPGAHVQYTFPKVRRFHFIVSKR